MVSLYIVNANNRVHNKPQTMLNNGYVGYLIDGLNELNAGQRAVTVYNLQQRSAN